MLYLTVCDQAVLPVGQYFFKLAVLAACSNETFSLGITGTKLCLLSKLRFVTFTVKNGGTYNSLRVIFARPW